MQGCGLPVRSTVEVDTVGVEGDAVVVRFSRDLGDAPVRLASASAFEAEVTRVVRAVYPNRPVRVETRGDVLAALVPNAERAPSDRDEARVFAPPVTGPPLTRPASAVAPTAGVAGRHIALWPSHGWLYNANSTAWGWQRAPLFTTIEDLMTVAFVTRELAPMLERAGAVTLIPRERDPQSAEVIVDDASAGYEETGQMWSAGPTGFGLRESYGDGVDPFALGTSRTVTGGARNAVSATWTPDLPVAGSYAVHVSYADGPDRTDAARYQIWHAGGVSEVLVNQQMGAGTWVYLGTFEFEAGTAGSVSLIGPASGASASADAVRFGGGSGIVEREGATSGRPRWIEAARYYEQFAGAPPFVYNVTGEPNNDYVDDYRSRGEWVNWLRGAPFGPTSYRDEPGLGIPVDLSLAWHTDAGIIRDGIVGTLAIYDVPGMDTSRVFPNGVSRLANRDLADGVQTQLVDDIRQLYSDDWTRRPLWDRNYSEAARPTVPSLLLELMSHQNYRDMRYALDPRFQFDAARAVYKGIGRFLAAQRGDTFVPQPLRPTHVSALLDGAHVALRWRPQPDAIEPDAVPTSYVVYARDGAIGWAEAARTDATSVRLPVPPAGVVRSYRVAGVNAGGEGRPSEALAVAVGDGPAVLVVDGFDRVAPPDAVDRPDRAGFVEPVGVPEGLGVLTVGRQIEFDPSAEYESDAQPGWGMSRMTLSGQPILGNDRDHTVHHAAALVGAGYAISSASDEAVWDGVVDLGGYQAVDLALGLERRTAWPDPDDTRPPAFEALPSALRQRLAAYLGGGGALVVSGAHWASDAARDPDSEAWVRRYLGVSADGKALDERAIELDGVVMPFAAAYSAERYAVRAPDVIGAVGEGETFGYYGGDGVPAGVHLGRTVSLGAPIEALLDDRQRAALLREALARVLGR